MQGWVYGTLFCISDPPSGDLDQLELPVLCDGLRRYLQDLPQPIIPTAVYAQMVHATKGESRRLRHRWRNCLQKCTVGLKQKCWHHAVLLCELNTVCFEQNHKTSLSPSSPEWMHLCLIPFLSLYAFSLRCFLGCTNRLNSHTSNCSVVLHSLAARRARNRISVVNRS